MNGEHITELSTSRHSIMRILPTTTTHSEVFTSHCQHRTQKPYPPNLLKPLADCASPKVYLCSFIRNVLRSLQHTLRPSLSSDHALFHRSTGRSRHHRLQAAVIGLGSKPVACTGSVNG
jgi:hypothetical protein